MLDLANTPVDDDIISTIAARCGQSLVALRLKGCTKLTPVAMDALVKYCEALEFLSVWEDAPEAALLKLHGFGYRLEHLDLSQCKHLSDKVLKVRLK